MTDPFHIHLPKGGWPGNDLPILKIEDRFHQRPSGLFTSENTEAEAKALIEARAWDEKMRYELWRMQTMMYSGMRGVAPYLFKDPMPEIDTTRAEPFVGYKTLKICHFKKQPFYLQGAYGVSYGIDATAYCAVGGGHSAPEWRCGCGFYALKDPPTAPEFGRFRAEVELFGTVIEGDQGWRASRQRVLSLQAFKTCICGRDATGFAIRRHGTVWPVCGKWKCGHKRLELADLNARLGTEVRWLDLHNV